MMLRNRLYKMINRERFERLVMSPDANETFRLLTEYGYPDMSGMDLRKINSVLSERRAAIFYDLKLDVPAADIVDMFRIKYDYHNIKVLIKSAGSAAELLSASGRVSPDRIAECFLRGETDSLPRDMRDAINVSQDVFSRTGDPQLADIAADKAYFAQLLRLADSIDCPYITSCARLMIDSANLRTVVRSLRMKKAAEFISGALIDGGTISPGALSAACVSGDVYELFANTRLKKAAEEARAAASGGSLTAFERECDNAVADPYFDAACVSFGPEPVAAYLSHLENELTSVRIILTGKLTGASPELIRERLRVCNVF